MTSWSPGSEIVDGHRSYAAISAVDDDLCACGLRIDTQAAGLGRVRELEILRNLGPSSDVHVDDARYAAPAELENVRTNRHREPRWCLAVIVPVDEHLHSWPDSTAPPGCPSRA